MPKKIPTQEGTQPDGTTWKLIRGKMHLLDRRPEWDVQHTRDREEYALRNEGISLNEFFETQLPESGEHGFRRGYGDGWRHAVETLWELMHGEELTLEETYQAMRRFAAAQQPLDQWAAGNCEHMTIPPSIGTVGVGKEVRAKRGKQEEEDG